MKNILYLQKKVMLRETVLNSKVFLLKDAYASWRERAGDDFCSRHSLLIGNFEIIGKTFNRPGRGGGLQSSTTLNLFIRLKHLICNNYLIIFRNFSIGIFYLIKRFSRMHMHQYYKDVSQPVFDNIFQN